MIARQRLQPGGRDGPLVPGQGLVVSATKAAVVPVTGLNIAGAEQYAGQRIAYVTVAAGRPGPSAIPVDGRSDEARRGRSGRAGAAAHASGGDRARTSPIRSRRRRLSNRSDTPTASSRRSSASRTAGRSAPSSTSGSVTRRPQPLRGRRPAAGAAGGGGEPPARKPPGARADVLPEPDLLAALDRRVRARTLVSRPDAAAARRGCAFERGADGEPDPVGRVRAMHRPERPVLQQPVAARGRGRGVPPHLADRAARPQRSSAAAAVTIGLYFELFQPKYLLLAALHFQALTVLWMTCAILWLDRTYWQVPAVFLAGAAAFWGSHSVGPARRSCPRWRPRLAALTTAVR